MTEEILNDNSIYPSVRETIQKFNMYDKINGSLSIPIKCKNNTHLLSSISSTSRLTNNENNSNSTEIDQPTSTTTTDLQSNSDQKSAINNKNTESISISTYASPAIIYKEIQISTNNNNRSNSIHYSDFDDIGLEIIEPIGTQKQIINNNERHDSIQCASSSIQCASSTIQDYEEHDIQQQSRDLYHPTSPPPLPPPVFTSAYLQEESNDSRKRSLPLTTFSLEIGALVVVFILCMILVTAIREEQANLRTAMQIVYTYVYLISIIWMIWCTFDIIKFRRQWIKLTSSAHDQTEYMDIVERYPHNISYFPDIHNTGGLFLKVGAGLLCIGSLLLTVIELAKTIEMVRTDSKGREASLTNYPRSVFLTKSIAFIFRFLFHCVQFIFLFRYGNLIIDRHRLIAKIGLIHVVIANFCTWFEAIVIETLEELHRHSESMISTNVPMNFNTTKSGIQKGYESAKERQVEMTTVPRLSSAMIDFLKAAPTEESSSTNTTTSILDFIEQIQLSIGVYLYPCLIEYSLISVTVFYIMCRNVGKTETRSFLNFGAHHIFTINCSRASCGLFLGGIIFVLTILTLIPTYILDRLSAIVITDITELVLLIVSLLIVCISFIYTTKLYYDRQAHVDIFDQILILITTVGDFAYSFFGIFASIFIESYTIKIPRFIEITIGLLAIFETVLQSAFILDALKRRSITKNEIQNKPGRELITALLLINLTIWMHDSLSAKKVKLNPLQAEYYDPETWAIVQAFTSPLSIFYRFHSSVCLADIWQEVYRDHGNNRSQKQNGINHSIQINNIPNHQH